MPHIRPVARMRQILKASVLAGTIVSAAIGMVRPAAAENVNLMQAYDRMLDAGIEFGMVSSDLDASAETVKQAKGQRLPRVEISLQYDRIRQDVVSSDNTAYTVGKSDYPKTSLHFTVRQPIYDAVKFRALPLSKAQDAVRQADAEIARNRIVRELIAAYLATAQAQLRVDRARVIANGRAKYSASLEEEIASGRKEYDTLTRAQSDELAAESDLMDAEIAYSDALADLQRYAGLDVTGVVIDGGKIGVVDLASVQQTMSTDALTQMSPELQSARASLDVTERQIESARGALHPSVDLVLDFEQQITEGSLFGGGSNTRQASGGVLLSVPIYEGGIRGSRVRESQAEMRGAALKVEQTERAVKARYQALMKAAKSTADRSNKLSRQLGLTVQTVQTVQERYDSGRVSEAVLLEQKLRRDTLVLDVRASRLQQLRVQAELYALFGALDMQTISNQAGG